MKNVCAVLFIFACLQLPAFAAGGACPTGTNYWNAAGTAQVTLASLGVTSCYFISAAGADTNAGTSEAAPLLHAPGMPNCANTCAGITPAGGVGFIVRGGDTYHFGNSGLSPYTGGSWDWAWSGSNGSPIYVGTDPTWFTGGSYANPVMNGDNALNTAFVGSCTFDQSTFIFLKLDHVSYVITDNLEFTGKCWSSTSTFTAYIYSNAAANSNLTLERLYCHGWTAVVTSLDGNYCYLGSVNAQNSNNIIDRMVVDGSDSSQGAANSASCSAAVVPSSPCQSGEAFYQEAAIVRFSVFRYVSNEAVTTNTTSYHDNLTEYLYNTYNQVSGFPHCNVLNNETNIPSSNLSFYNNIIRHIYCTEAVYLAVGSNAYIFNNVFWDMLWNYNSGSSPNNCLILGTVSNAVTVTAYLVNNTFDSSGPVGGSGAQLCKVQFSPNNSPLQSWNGTAIYQNNHLIAYGGTTLSLTYFINSNGAGGCAATCTITDNGHEVYQTEAVANGQGYVTTNNYAPTSAGNATVGAGGSNTGVCSTFSSDSALCSGTSGAVLEQAGNGGQIASYPAITIKARSSSLWDSGAYQFQSQIPPAQPPGVNATFFGSF